MSLDQRYDAQSTESQLQKQWADQSIFNPSNNPGPRFTIDTPPPTVSGSLHIGHIFSYTQTDIIARYKRMSGFSVVYPFGFDDNGLPTERFVEKKTGIKAYQVGRSAFINTCLEQTREVEALFKTLWQRMGLSVNWEYEYSTIAENVRRISQASFLDLLKKGFAYRRQEPALYCTECRTSVAQAELDDAELPATFNDIIFTDAHGTQITIATTRPELLPACVALMVHPDDARYKNLIGTKVTVPLFGITVPVIEDELVKIDKGTGAVMCCTFGDNTDIIWYKKHQLPFVSAIGLDGRMTAIAGEFQGLKVAEARTQIIERLKEQKLLTAQKQITHNVAIHERCKKPIEYTVLSQWFISILAHKQELIKIADEIEWYPAFMKTRYVNWVENLGWDWCISRQRFFGIPFPVWHCTNCNTVIPAPVEQLPLDPQETPYQGSCPQCNTTTIVPDTDVMDTWNTSALTPYIIYELVSGKRVTFTDADKGIEGLLPMSMRPQAHDIIRTWAFYTIARAWMHHKSIPWKTIIISGHVLSEQKDKLSKSKGNATLTPEALLQQYSADIIRYWTGSGALGHDVPFSDNQLKIGQKLTTKLWNAFKFIEIHCNGMNSSQTSPTKVGDVNKWILTKASHCFAEYHKALEQSEFGTALLAVEKFFWHDFCDNYLELIKDQLFKPERYMPEIVDATRWTLYNVGLRILQLYAPYLPYITDALFNALYAQHGKSVHTTKFSDVQKPVEYAESVHELNVILDIVAQVRKLKSEQNLSLKTTIKQLTIASAEEASREIVEKHEQLLAGVLNIESFAYVKSDTPTSIERRENDSWYTTVGI
jgi:valyl-tRNA synthetase